VSGTEHALAVGWPVALTVAAIVVRERARDARRRGAINEALHELRRPLQALALFPHGTGAAADAGPATLELALAALDDLDREVNGGETALRMRPVACRACVEDSLGRWRTAAGRRGSAIELRWRAGTATVLADPRRLAQALDNLIANSLEHAAPPVRVEGTLSGGRVRIAVRDGGSPGPGPSMGAARMALAGLGMIAVRGGDARRGHGLAVVARIASEHGGRFVVGRDGDGTAAVLELPLARRADPAIVPARAA